MLRVLTVNNVCIQEVAKEARVIYYLGLLSSLLPDGLRRILLGLFAEAS